MTYRAVCVSQVTAAGGETVGRLVAERLGFRYVDDEVISVAAANAGIDPTALASAEHYTGLLTRFVDALVTALAVPPGDAAGYFPPDTEYYHPEKPPPVPPPLDEARDLIVDAILEIAKRGNVVIVAHAASMALKGHADVLRVHVTASMPTRVRRVSLPNKLISEQEHTKVLAESDRQRLKYLDRFYGVTQELPTHYDLVINTDALDVQRAVAAIVAVATAE
jgi:cytidylate kinase